MKQAKEVDASSGGCPSTGSGRTDMRDAPELCCQADVTPSEGSCEEVFAECQGEMVFLEDADAPTIDEWSDV